MGKAKAKRQHKGTRKPRAPRAGDSSAGLPGVMAIASEADYHAAYRYNSGVRQIRNLRG
jgi:hypothetical protein